MTVEYELETNGYNYSNLVLVGLFMTIEDFFLLNTYIGRYHFHYVLHTLSMHLCIVINNLNLKAMSLLGYPKSLAYMIF